MSHSSCQLQVAYQQVGFMPLQEIVQLFVYYNRPLIAHVGTGTSATLQMPGIGDSSWRFTYEFRGERLNS